MTSCKCVCYIDHCRFHPKTSWKLVFSCMAIIIQLKPFQACSQINDLNFFLFECPNRNLSFWKISVSVKLI